MWYKNAGTSFFRFVTMHAFFDTDRQTDGQKGLRNTVRCITCNRTVKTFARAEINVKCLPAVISGYYHLTVHLTL